MTDEYYVVCERYNGDLVVEARFKSCLAAHNKLKRMQRDISWLKYSVISRYAYERIMRERSVS